METRDRLLDAALGLFASRGYDAVGVQEIVAAVGVTKPTLYHHFGSKRGLLEALLDQHGGAFASELEAAAAYAGDLPLTLDRVAAAHFALAATRPDFYRLLLALAAAPPDHEAYAAAAPFLERQRALLEALFARAACDHGNMRGRHRRYALTFAGALNAYAGLAINGLARADARARRELVHQFSHGIYS